MSPDPFRALDRLDPPDQWDEIAHRAGSDDIAVDLDAVRTLRPRRRATLLVAAAAAVALVAGGVAVTHIGDADGEGVTATDAADGAAMEGPCPFTLDPEAVPADLVPGTGRPPFPAYTGSWRRPEGADLSVPGSWGTVDYGGIPVTVGVYAAEATPQESGVTVELPDDPAVIDIVAWGPVDGATAPCATAEVRVRLPLTDEDRERRAAGDEITGGDYLSDPVPPRILHAVRLAPPSDPAAADAEPCAQLMEQGPPTTVTGTPTAIEGRLADGRGFTVSIEGDEVLTSVSGDDGGSGGTRPDGPDQWLYSTDGILVGWLPPDTVLTGVVRPDGVVVADGAVVWHEGELFAIPDVGQAPGAGGEDEPWPVVHCSAADVQAIFDERLEEATALGARDEELSRQIQQEAEAYQERLACRADPASCPEPGSTTTGQG